MKTKFATVAASFLLVAAGMGVVGATTPKPGNAMGKYPLVLGDHGGSPGFT